jgi:hypothetical protein
MRVDSNISKEGERQQGSIVQVADPSTIDQDASKCQQSCIHAVVQA